MSEVKTFCKRLTEFGVVCVAGLALVLLLAAVLMAVCPGTLIKGAWVLAMIGLLTVCVSLAAALVITMR